MFKINSEIDSYWELQTRNANKIITLLAYSFCCTLDVMAPTNRVSRSFGEYLQNLDAKFERCLDLGCGSGILGIVLAGKSKEVIGIDSDSSAITNAKYNASLNQIKNISFVQGDAYQGLREGKFDLIVTNPPFYPPDEAPFNPKLSVANHSALLYESIFGLPKYLTDSGFALLVSSSLSDNDKIIDSIERIKFAYSLQVLHQGIGSSQDIYLWKIFRNHVQQ